MGKIRVQDLAKMMGIANQDLVFKLKSIGVRVEGDDAHIDTDIIQAILQGKKLPHPREVILRDETAPPAPDPKRRTAAPAAPQAPARRQPANPLRPQRPRTLIQKVEPRIQTLPTLERPVPVAEPEPSEREVQAPETAAPAVHEPPPLEIAASAEPAVSPAPPATPGHPATDAPRTTGPSAPPRQVATPSTPPRRDVTTPSGPPRRDGAPSGPRRDGPPSGPRRDGPPSPTGPRRDGPPSGPRRDGSPSPTGPRRDGPGGGYGAPRQGGPGGGGGYGAPRQGPGGGGYGAPRREGGPSAPASTRPGSPYGGGLGRATAAPAPSPADDRRRPGESAADRNKKKKGVKKPGPHIPGEEELNKVHTLQDLEGEEEDFTTATGRRRRRVARKEEEKEEGGKVLSFKKAPPTGPVTVNEGMTLREFAEKLGVKVRDLMKALFNRGILANINQVIEPELAQQIAKDLGVDTMVVSFEEEQQIREEAVTTETGTETARVGRAPVVTIMGHVDHGKTSLLDSIRSSKVTESEFGGITQHIGAYQVEANGRAIVFLDTPGHEAFTMMRARGAKVTDIVVLVVAADDGVMPQTIEAIDHARAAKVPIVVAINKMDKANANPDRVKKELSDRGLMPEDWGGDTVMVPISALRKEGISDLMDMILLTADILDLKASPELRAQGAVLEARKDIGRGIVATVLVQNGTLKVGDIFVTGNTWGRVRSMSDDRGNRAQSAGPATPVEVTGFSDVPDAGDLMQVVEDESRARGIVDFRQEEHRRRGLTPVQARLSLEQLFDRIQEGEVKELPVVLKADVQGSVEVLKDAIAKASTEKVKVQVIHFGVGAISTNDVLLASASKAIIIGFNVRPERSAAELAEKEGVDIRLHTIIYELIDELRKAMTGLLEPTFREVSSGRAEVRDTFKVPRIGTIAGCHVLDGVIPRSASVRLLRDNRVIYEGKISSLRRFKDDASEVRAGFDCGIGLERFQDVKPGDIIEAFTREEVAPSL
ncbi:MAG TPA: translation initiation factor IF-2 [Thermoanaerobaculia bacterium]|nr:translation initiation factor IF-2 [Thermoanaerobaculia bacterium]